MNRVRALLGVEVPIVPAPTTCIARAPCAALDAGRARVDPGEV